MIIRGSRQELERQAASLVAEGINRTLASHSLAAFAVVGGRSVGAVLDLLAGEQVDWRRVHLFMADERLVEPDHPDSNYRLVSSHVCSYMAPTNLHPFLFIPGEEQAALTSYRRELEGVGGRLDVLLLSSGEDGHVASLFPEHETIDSPDEFFLITDSAPKPPPRRMSASAKLLSRASAAVLLFLGAGKQQAFARCIDDTVAIRACPAGLVRAVDNHFLLTDSDGAAHES